MSADPRASSSTDFGLPPPKSRRVREPSAKPATCTAQDAWQEEIRQLWRPSSDHSLSITDHVQKELREKEEGLVHITVGAAFAAVDNFCALYGVNRPRGPYDSSIAIAFVLHSLTNVPLVQDRLETVIMFAIIFPSWRAHVSGAYKYDVVGYWREVEYMGPEDWRVMRSCLARVVAIFVECARAKAERSWAAVCKVIADSAVLRSGDHYEGKLSKKNDHWAMELASYVFFLISKLINREEPFALWKKHCVSEQPKTQAVNFFDCTVDAHFKPKGVQQIRKCAESNCYRNVDASMRGEDLNLLPDVESLMATVDGSKLEGLPAAVAADANYVLGYVLHRRLDYKAPEYLVAKMRNFFATTFSQCPKGLIANLHMECIVLAGTDPVPQKCIIMKGCGGNGKTLDAILRHSQFGRRAKWISPTCFTVRDEFRKQGCGFVDCDVATVDEATSQCYLEEDVYKAFVSNGPLSCRMPNIGVETAMLSWPRTGKWWLLNGAFRAPGSKVGREEARKSWSRRHEVMELNSSYTGDPSKVDIQRGVFPADPDLETFFRSGLAGFIKMTHFTLPHLERTTEREIVEFFQNPCAERQNAAEKFADEILSDGDVEGGSRRDGENVLFPAEGETLRDDILLGGPPIFVSRVGKDRRIPSGGKRAPRDEVVRSWCAQNLFEKVGGVYNPLAPAKAPPTLPPAGKLKYVEKVDLEALRLHCNNPQRRANALIVQETCAAASRQFRKAGQSSSAATFAERSDAIAFDEKQMADYLQAASYDGDKSAPTAFVETEYFYKRESGGRRYCSAGAQVLSRETRSVCFGALCLECDLTNSHVVIANELSKKMLGEAYWGKMMEPMRKYAESREEALSEIKLWLRCGDSDAKHLMLRLLNGGTVLGALKALEVSAGGIASPPPFLKAFSDCAAFLSKVIEQQRPDLAAAFCDRDRAAFSALHYALAEVEDRIVCVAEKCCEENGFVVRSLHHDGFYVETQNEGKLADVLSDCNASVALALGYNVLLRVKKVGQSFWDAFRSGTGLASGKRTRAAAEGNCVFVATSWLLATSDAAAAAKLLRLAVKGFASYADASAALAEFGKVVQPLQGSRAPFGSHGAFLLHQGTHCVAVKIEEGADVATVYDPFFGYPADTPRSLLGEIVASAPGSRTAFVFSVCERSRGDSAAVGGGLAGALSGALRLQAAGFPGEESSSEGSCASNSRETSVPSQDDAFTPEEEFLRCLAQERDAVAEFAAERQRHKEAIAAYRCSLCVERTFPRKERLRNHVALRHSGPTCCSSSKQLRLARAIFDLDRTHQALAALGVRPAAANGNYMRRSADAMREMLQDAPGAQNLTHATNWDKHLALLLTDGGPTYACKSDISDATRIGNAYCTDAFLRLVFGFCILPESKGSQRRVRGLLLAHFTASGCAHPGLLPGRQFVRKLQSFLANNPAVRDIARSARLLYHEAGELKVLRRDASFKFLTSTMYQPKHGKHVKSFRSETNRGELHAVHTCMTRSGALAGAVALYSEGLPQVLSALLQSTDPYSSDVEVIFSDSPSTLDVPAVFQNFANLRCIAGDPLHRVFEIESCIAPQASPLAKYMRLLHSKFTPKSSFHLCLEGPPFSKTRGAAAAFTAREAKLLSDGVSAQLGARLVAKLQAGTYADEPFASRYEYLQMLAALVATRAADMQKRHKKGYSVRTIFRRSMGSTASEYLLNGMRYICQMRGSRLQGGREIPGTTTNESLHRELRSWGKDVWSQLPDRAVFVLAFFLCAKMISACQKLFFPPSRRKEQEEMLHLASGAVCLRGCDRQGGYQLWHRSPEFGSAEKAASGALRYPPPQPGAKSTAPWMRKACATVAARRNSSQGKASSPSKRVKKNAMKR